MRDKIQTIGYAAKGIVYTIIGALTALVAVDMGGSKTGRSGVIDFLQQQPFGKFILYALAIGVLAYALWRIYTAIADPKSEGGDASGIVKRIGFACSGLLYLLFSVTIFMTAVGSGGGGGGNKQYYAAQLLDKSYGPFLIGLIGIIIICTGIYQTYKGYSNKYLEELNPGYGRHERVLKKFGKFGFMARGVIFGIIGYFVLRAGVTDNAELVRGIQGAFSFLQQQSYGTFLMGCIAAGLLAYGIFIVYVSKDTRVHS